MTREDLGAVVRGILATALERPVAAAEEVERSREGAWDSVKHIEILFMLEEALGVTFDEEEIPMLDSVSGIVDRASARLGAA